MEKDGGRMANYKTYINALRNCAKEHENDITPFAHIRVSDLCRDTANLLEELEQEPVIDKIRAEILEEKECAYADFERYKVEYLGQDSEDVLDSLPQDDFRYGMERCVDIIDKYKRESEVDNGNNNH